MSNWSEEKPKNILKDIKNTVEIIKNQSTKKQDQPILMTPNEYNWYKKTLKNLKRNNKNEFRIY